MEVWGFHENRRTSEELRKLVGVEPITTIIRNGRLRWYGHVMRKSDKNWVKKCMEYKAEGIRLVGRPRRTWLESVEADMAAPNGTAYKWWSCHSGHKLLCKLCLTFPTPSNGIPIYRFFWQAGHAEPLDG